jgi:acetyltransferase
MDINPLIVDENGAVAVDARIRVDYPRQTATKYDHLAIHPYPSQFVKEAQLPNGMGIIIRPIRPEDLELEANFVQELSPETIHQLQLSPELLMKMTQIDYSQEMVLVAVDEANEDFSLGFARYLTKPDKRSCELLLVISDRWQGHGLGHKLMSSLMDIARTRGLETMEANVREGNAAMLDLMVNLRFKITGDGEVKRVSIRL